MTVAAPLLFSSAKCVIPAKAELIPFRAAGQVLARKDFKERSRFDYAIVGCRLSMWDEISDWRFISEILSKILKFKSTADSSESTVA
jgi:hypothetical protein